MLGWHDYALAVGRLPVEAQAHQVWYFAKHPDTLSPTVSRRVFDVAFPDIGTVPRPEQKHRLRVAIAQARTDSEVMNDARTDPLALVLR